MGIGLLEVSLGLAITGLVLAAAARAVGESNAAVRAVGAGARLAEVAGAAQSYLHVYRASLLQNTEVGGDPIALRVARTSPAESEPPTPPGGFPSLQMAGMLTPAFVDTNNFGHRHLVLVRQPRPGQLEALVIQVGGRPVPDGDLGRIVNRVGASGGAMMANPPPATPRDSVAGFGGGWSAARVDWTTGDGAAPTQGRAAAIVAIGAAAGGGIPAAGGSVPPPAASTPPPSGGGPPQWLPGVWVTIPPR